MAHRIECLITALVALALFALNPRPASAFTSGDDLSVTDATVTFVLHFELVAGKELREAPNGNVQSRRVVVGYLLPGDAPEEIRSMVENRNGVLLLHKAATEGGIEVNGRWVPLVSDHCYDIPTAVHYDAEGRPDNVRTTDLLDVTGERDHTQYDELLEELEKGSFPVASPDPEA